MARDPTQPARATAHCAKSKLRISGHGQKRYQANTRADPTSSSYSVIGINLPLVRLHARPAVSYNETILASV